MARCECCDLDEASCGRAAETKQRRELAAFRRKLLARGWIVAIWPGFCVRCGADFEQGVPIRKAVGGPGWIAECCAEQEVTR
jgi:hypothetical protein